MKTANDMIGYYMQKFQKYLQANYQTNKSKFTEVTEKTGQNTKHMYICIHNKNTKTKILKQYHLKQQTI